MKSKIPSTGRISRMVCICAWKREDPSFRNSLIATFENHVPHMRMERIVENSKHSEGECMQTPNSPISILTAPDHMSPADPVKVWLDHPHRRPFASSCGLHHTPILQRTASWDWTNTLFSWSEGGPDVAETTQPRYRWAWAQKYLIYRQQVETIGW